MPICHSTLAFLFSRVAGEGGLGGREAFGAFTPEPEARGAGDCEACGRYFAFTDARPTLVAPEVAKVHRGAEGLVTLEGRRDVV